jgi:hypothetical protein
MAVPYSGTADHPGCTLQLVQEAARTLIRVNKLFCCSIQVKVNAFIFLLRYLLPRYVLVNLEYTQEVRYGTQFSTAVAVPVRTKITVQLQVRVTLSKVCAAKRHAVSFVGSGVFYWIFQHTDGNRPHSTCMACGGRHS